MGARKVRAPGRRAGATRSGDEFIRWKKGQSALDLLRLVTCGSVDDGKSTLIGRLLWESRQVCEDELAALEVASRRHGTQGEALDLALLVDGLAAEREQGITIDVGYRFFSSARRRFIVADSPGHEQYTRNMVTASSNADVAVLLLDVRQGLLAQTRRHAYLVSLMGIRRVVLAVNKMDLAGFDAAVFDGIQREFTAFAQPFGFSEIMAIPISALAGDNVCSRSGRAPWYAGPTLLEYLETVDIARAATENFVMPVQWVNRPNADFRGFSGTVAAGTIRVGDPVRVTSSGQVARVRSIVAMDGDLAAAAEGEAVSLVLDRHVDVSRGEVLTTPEHPLQATDQFEATIIWMHEEDGLVGRTYDLKIACQWAVGSITAIKYRVNVNTLAHESCRQLGLNDIAVCNLALAKPAVFEAYARSRTMGGFILVDRFTSATVAAGLITHDLRRGQNVHRQALSITRADRERLNGHAGKVVWFTGLSGSGKSTIADALEKSLHAQGRRTYVLDGDNIRQGLNKDLGFTDGDRVENMRRVAEVARLMLDAGLIVLVSFISPFRQEREFARELMGAGNFHEVFVDTPLEICERRDPKGLYKKARRGEIPNMTGINSAYERPLDPDFVVSGEDRSLEEIVAGLNRLLESGHS
jgi:bifunctional enzyme CysN/CysC